MRSTVLPPASTSSFCFFFSLPIDSSVPSLVHIVAQLENANICSASNWLALRGRGAQCPTGYTPARVADPARPAAPSTRDQPRCGVREPLTGLVTVGQGPILGSFVAQGGVRCPPLPGVHKVVRRSSPRIQPQRSSGELSFYTMARQGPVAAGTACLSSPSPVLSGPLAHLRILHIFCAPLFFSLLPCHGSSPFL